MSDVIMHQETQDQSFIATTLVNSLTPPLQAHMPIQGIPSLNSLLEDLPNLRAIRRVFGGIGETNIDFELQ